MELVLSRVVFRIFSRKGWGFHGGNAKNFTDGFFFFTGKKNAAPIVLGGGGVNRNVAVRKQLSLKTAPDDKK